MGVAIAKGILKTLNIDYKTATTPKKETTTLYRVQVGAFSNKENAENLKKKLKANGYDAFIVTVN